MRRKPALWELRRARTLRRAGVCLAAASLAGVVAVGGAVAFFSDVETVENRLSVAERLDVAVVEPAWDPTDGDGDGVPDASQDLAPRARVPKDPRVENRAGVECWMVAQVEVPVVKASVVGPDGLATPEGPVELFSWELGDGWSEYGKAVPSADGSSAVHTYLASAPVAVGAATPPVFERVVLADLVEGSFEGGCTVNVTGHGIQTLGFESPAAAWEALMALDGQATAAEGVSEA